jgi:hypothetical protein
MEKFVVSRELAEKLKAAHYNQKANYYWRIPRIAADDIPANLLLVNREDTGPNGFYKYVAAPLSDELLEQLWPITLFPTNVSTATEQAKGRWRTGKVIAPGEAHRGFCREYADSPADALAKTWLWLEENGYLEVPSHVQ